MHRKSFYHILAGSTALALIAYNAAAQQYLPPSRYEQGGLPSPTLLYPERTQPLYPAPAPTEGIAPLPEPVMIAPEPYMQSDTTAAVPVDEPVMAAPQPVELQRQPLAPAPSNDLGLILPPPPAPSGDIPIYQSITTLESQRGLSAPVAMPPSDAPARTPPAQTTTPPAPPVKAPAPIAAPPVETPLVVEPEPEEAQEELDAASQSILARIPSGIDTPPGKGSKSTLERFDPDIQGVLDAPEGEDAIMRHESMGVQIEVRQPNLDVNLELQNAYEALMGGQPQMAMQIYKDILAQQPRNADGLFGVATTYHRMGELERAKPYYIKLLKHHPKHRDGLTNFLSMVASEAPHTAAAKLEYLATQNPDFSAIPALLGTLYEKMGKSEAAEESLIRAVRMEPDNVAYKYNLAVLYDTHGKVAQATVLYNQLLAAGRSGIPLPSPMRDLQERVIHINQKAAEG